MRNKKGQFLKGFKPWNAGTRKKLNCEICGIAFYPQNGNLKQKYCSINCRITAFRKKHPAEGKHWVLSKETCLKMSKRMQGENHWNWKGGISKKIGYQKLRYYLSPKKKMSGQKRRFIMRGGGELTIQTIQQVYEDNIKKYGTLTCIYCLLPIQFSNDSLEHKIPLSRGGTNEYGNLAIACKGCNSKKNKKTLEEFKECLE